MIDATTLSTDELDSLQGIENYKSLNQLDRKLHLLLPELFEKPIFFIEAGANDGISQSNTFAMEKNCGARGILVEPCLNKFASLIVNRNQENYFKCAALVSRDYDDDIVRMLYCDLMTLPLGKGDGTTEHGYEYKHFNSGTPWLPPQMKEPIKFGAEPVRLSDVIDSASAPSVIDFLSLDVEGYEVEALLGVDFSSHSFRYMLIETWNLQRVIDLLPESQYSLHAKLSEHDYLFKLLG